MLIDSHAHLSIKRFQGTFKYLHYDDETAAYRIGKCALSDLLSEMAASDIVASVEPAINLASNALLLEFARQQPGRVFPAVGLHPAWLADVKWSDRKLVWSLAQSPKVVAIGETGLDYHRDKRLHFRQHCWFVNMILLAHRRRLPLILHVREANAAALRVLTLARPFLHGGVAHCFCSDWAVAQRYLRLGFHLGIGGTLLQEGSTAEALREAVRHAPLERLLLETDSPYVHPACTVLDSGKKRHEVCNTPLILPAVADKIAELKGISRAEVERATTENAIRLFRLDAHGLNNCTTKE